MRQTRRLGHARPMRNTWTKAFAAVAASLLWAPTAPAGYVQLTQTRAITTTASAVVSGFPSVDDRDTETSDALGSFDRSVTSSAAAGIPAPPFNNASGWAEASQAVQLAPTSISGTFVADANASSRLGRAVSEASSTWSTTFRVDQPTPFDLDGRVRVRDPIDVLLTQATSTLSLSIARRADVGGAEETLSSFPLLGPPSPGFTSERLVDVAGVLEPGYVYRLAVTAHLSETASLPADVQIGGQLISDVTFTLTMVPEPSTAVVAAGLTVGILRRPRRRMD